MRRLLGTALAAVALVLALGAPAAEAKRVRVFTVGPKFEKGWVSSRDAFRDHLRGLAGQVASQKLGPADPARAVDTARDLVTLPEDLGLMAAFTGQRGESARRATDLTTSIVGLLGTYAPVSAYYVGKFPSLGARPFPPTRALAVALTDTFVRVGVETFAEIADEQDAWVVAGVTLVRDWQVVCESKATYKAPPGAGPCAVEDPGKVAMLRAPEESDRTYAYEAKDAKPSTQALVFDPDGKLRAKVVKAYLTPVELPGQLDLVPGDPSGVQVVPTPVGRIGIVTSKDAWMPDVIDKLDARRADVLVQPEFFVGDTLRTTGPWAPDNLRGSGYAALLRSPSITSWAIPELVGNVFDFSADAQQAIAVEPAGRRGPIGGMAGQPPTRGFVAVQPYVVRDPAELDVAARRKVLGEAGEKLLPGSGVPCPSAAPGPCENGHVEGVLSADVQVLEDPRPRRVARARKAPAPFAASKFLTRARAAQRNVALATRGSSVWAAFEQADRVLVARSRDGGRTWGAPVRVDRRGGEAAEWFPAIAAGPAGELWVAWQEGERVALARSSDDGATWAAPQGTDGEGAQWRPSVASTGKGSAVLAWVDERGSSPSDGLPQASVRTAVAGDDGRPGASRRLDRTGATAPLAAEMDHAWFPVVAARGKDVQAAWLDFRTYDWRVATRTSGDGGATWAAGEVEATKVPASTESLAQQPAVAVTSAGPLVAWADWFKDPDSAARASRLHDVVLAAPGKDPLQIDGDGDKFRHAFAPKLAAAPDGGAVVALQSHRRGDADVALVRVGAGPGRVGEVRRADDDGAAGHGAWRPAVAVSGRFAVVAWEDDRGGPAQLRVTRARLAALG